MTILKSLRPDRLLASSKKIIGTVLGEEILNEPVVDLAYTVEHEVTCRSPLLLCSVTGYDPSQKVDNLAKDLNKRYASVAIGSAEGFDIADKAITAATKQGTWVLLKNVHLAPSWLAELEKKLHKLTPNENFRLFLTMEIQPKVPSTLIRISETFVFEPPPGIKASMQRSFKAVLSQDRTDKQPGERARLHFLVCWLHAVLQERLRYTPIGWTKLYEFGEADQRCALKSIDEWIESIGQGRTNVPPEKIPWDALRTIITTSLYGGKIDNDFDHAILKSFVNHLFNEQAFDLQYPLFIGEGALMMPDARTYEQFENWIN